MTVNTSTASELTAEQVASILVRPLESASMFLASGPVIYDTTGPFRLPKAPTAAGYVASRYIITVAATEGTFDVAVDEGTPAEVAYNASAATLATALETLTEVAAGTAIVTGPDGGPYDVTLTGGGVIGVDGTDLAGGTVTATAVSADTTVPFTGESALIPEANPVFDEVELLPSSMKSVKVITRFSNELARASVVSLEAALRDRLVRSVASRLDSQFFSAGGDGTTTPQGMFAWEDTQTVTVNGAPDLDDVMDAQALALSADVDPARLRLFVRPETYMALRGLKVSETDARYLLQPDAQQGGIGTIPILGMPTVVSKRIPVGYAAVADMSHVAVARDVAPSVTLLAERYADYDEQAIRVVARYDVKPVNPEAVVKLTGIA